MNWVPRKKRRHRLRPEKPTAFDGEYRKLWRVVDGAVRDALANHPEYVSNNIRHSDVRRSIVKRAVGAVLGYQAERRSGKFPGV